MLKRTGAILAVTAAGILAQGCAPIVAGVIVAVGGGGGGGGGGSGTTGTAPPAPPPAPPTGTAPAPIASLKTTLEGTVTAHLTWTPDPNATGYRVERAISGGAFQSRGQLPSGASEYRDGSLALDTEYEYRVVALWSGGEVLPAAAVTFLTAPIPPTSLQAAISGDDVVLTWQDAGKTTFAFQIERSVDGGGYTPFDVGGSPLTYQDAPGLDHDVTYRIRARNGGGLSDPTSPVSTRTRPIPPTALTATALARNKVKLTITDAATREDGYTIERRTGAAAFAAIGSLSGPQSGSVAFVDSTVSPSTSYDYRVFATNAGGASDVSPIATATTPTNTAPVITVTGLRAVRLDEEIEFQVEVNDPDGDAVDFDILSQPLNLVLAPGHGAASPLLQRGVWVGTGCGRYPVKLRATDGTATTTKTVTFEVKIGGNQPGDVTGDGVPDLIAVARTATVGGKASAGALFVWDGTDSPFTTPRAMLADPAPTAGDQFSKALFRLADVTGDGVLDVIATAPASDAGGVDRGAVFVWAGGAGLTGSPAPTATLFSPTVGSALSTNTFELGDLDGDGVLDIAIAVNGENVVRVWRGGATLTGTPATWATLPYAGGHADLDLVDVVGGKGVDLVVLDDALGEVRVYEGGASLSASSLRGMYQASGMIPKPELVRYADVTGDGRTDLLVGTRLANAGGTSRGAVYVFAGGSAGPAPTATLAGLADNDRLGGFFRCKDVTGDGVADVVAVAEEARVSGYPRTGYVAVWAGGAGLTGTPAQTAFLTLPVHRTDDLLGDGKSLLLDDVTGDGVAEVIVGSLNADLEQDGAHRGAVLIWTGGAGLTGSPAGAWLRGGGSIDPRRSASGSLGMVTVDVIGDSKRDIIVRASSRLFIWAGRSVLGAQPAVDTAFVSTTPPFYLVEFGGMHLADLTGDGQLDILIASQESNINSTPRVGACVVYELDRNLRGYDLPQRAGFYPSVQSYLYFTQRQPDPLLFADLNGDGVLDVSGPVPKWSYFASQGGGVVTWFGGATLTGVPAPDVSFQFQPPYLTNMFVGSGSSRSLLMVGGNLVAAMPDGHSRVTTASQSGGFLLRRTGSGFGTNPSEELRRPVPIAGDRLGD